jgi:hypothetical protein
MCAWQLQAQDDDSYEMFQLIQIEPMAGHQQELQAAIKSHNDEFHKEGAQRVNVWGINSGPRAGSMIWAKGPLMWSDMDNPIEGDEHMQDWWGNVMKHSSIGGIEFWRHWKGLHYMPEDFNPKVLVLRTFKVHEQKWNNVEHIWKPMIKLYEEKGWNEGVRVYWNEANAGDDRDLTIVWYYENWSEMDVDREFFKAMDEMYDIDRREFFENWTALTDYKGMEIWTLNEELSAAGSSDD